jgi:prophage antirepressor-like protein
MQETQNQIIPFGYGDNLVRVIEDKNGEPLWVAKDICNILGYQKTQDMTKWLDEDETLNLKEILKGEQKAPLQKLNMRYDTALINESGLYSAIFRSNKPEAKKFKKWVTSEVLPTIRKTGSYGVKNQGVSEHILNQMIEANKEIHLTIMGMIKNQEHTLKAIMNMSENINTIKSRINDFDRKIENIGSVAVKTNIILKDTYNYVKYQPLSREERARLQDKIKQRGVVLAGRHNITKENAIASIYRMLNKTFDLTTYHELEHKDFLSAYDWVDYVELGNDFESSPTKIDNPLEEEYGESEQSSARDIYGNRF